MVAHLGGDRARRVLDAVADLIIAAPGSSSKEALEHHLRALNAILTDTGTGPLLRDVVAASASDPAMARAVRRMAAPPSGGGGRHRAPGRR